MAYCIVLVIFFFTFNIQAKSLTIALGNFEPLFSEKNKPALFKDLIDGVYTYIPNRNINYRYMFSNARLVRELNAQTIDGAANIFSKNEIQGCLTLPIFTYSDVAISLKSKHYTINSVSDLKEKSVVSYQRAMLLLGREYKQAVLLSKYYKEVAQPLEQAKLLSNDMVDVSIGDKYIFLHSLKNYTKDNLKPNDFEIHDIFPSVASSMGFNDQKLCDEFNEALIKYKNSGKYQLVYQNYLEKLGFFNKNNN
ncbi:hypothetical protein CJF42_08620 [Pseudoalteromonas sp. NBT06-2]|uniref:substrate-binding periplasmic protein n=1 Tax=Pseudoalteromonas sp. NBT06-2 TaxID=2025950 RepID=UPI000BA7B6ED|nr:transporter substrate-binding domain-containing protein [Pseudoalteromonas sp. NBT06-2]PAJ74738.1 hypothetical protein CJF42_08620 [Pseudoalteromonas sp. NBT06-2]